MITRTETTLTLTLTTVAIACLSWIAMPTIIEDFVANALTFISFAIGAMAIAMIAMALSRAYVALHNINHHRALTKLDIEERKADIAIKQAKAVAGGRMIQVIRPNERLVVGNHLGELSLLDGAQLPESPRLPGGALVDGHGGDLEMPCLIDVMAQHQRLLLIGGSGSGKTNVLKHFVSKLVSGGERLLILDPHSPSKLAGCDVVGAKFDFEAIADKMLELTLMINNRYQTGEIAQDGELDNGNIWLIIDELRDIKKECGDIYEMFLECLLVRGRKAGVKFCLVAQNDTISSLGLAGDKGLFRACRRVTLDLDDVTMERTAYIGWSKTERQELALPGVYQDNEPIPVSQLVIEQPQRLSDSERSLALTVAGLNGQAHQLSKAEIFRRANVGKNKPMNDFLTKLLEG